MSITFKCEHCHKEVKAPDAAGGKRGKCPFCGGSTYIPSPVAEEDLLDLAPDDDELRRIEEQKRKLYELEHDLIAHNKGEPSAPLDQKENLDSDDLHHFAINYVLEMARGNIEAADLQLRELKKFGLLGAKAVEEIISGKVEEPALDAIPRRTKDLYLSTLKSKLR
ncbi:MAG: hypothetical protein WC869_05930 [Phycisphaerae bacterium]|jgi:hypothetical protein